MRLKFFSTTKVPEGEAKDLFPAKGYSVDENGNINRVTTVILFAGSTPQPEAQIGIVSVTKHYKDPDIPVLAQKFAIEKLISRNSFTRTERTEIWEAFWNYSKKAESIRHGAYSDELTRIKYYVLPVMKIEK